MTNHSQSDYLSDYDRAITELKSDPNNLEFRHQAVLALARAGSLDFAVTEFKRYGLDRIRHHEDIMALGGRLSKDLYLESTGKTALEHARDSADKYEAAFKDTKGYYSGINAATMALMADMPCDMVMSRVQHVLDILPSTEDLSPTDHYFIEATRAECFLLRRENVKAEACLRSAVAFDPLNYPAHASTLKQFRLILNQQKESQSWLEGFSPPRPVHFAGHIWATPSSAPNPELTHEDVDALMISISDKIQRHDIGFGYGALAAGADILIAEILLREGAELNVILPCDTDSFIEHSVRPFGEAWVSRFKSCLDKAQSLTSLTGPTHKLSGDLNIMAARIAMGQAILRGHHFDVSAAQVLIWDNLRKGSYTSHHAADWQETGLKQVIIPMVEVGKISSPALLRSDSIAVKLARSDTEDIVLFKTPMQAVEAAIHMMSDAQNLRLGLHFDMQDSDAELQALIARNLHHSIMMPEAFASCVALSQDDRFAVKYAGRVKDKAGRLIRSYILQVMA
ncbi:TRAFs-binding domain-containing protein [Robiginitomaculum antarcticum]|uniref:TRAFs-binding domain-containing protein n=1 Tax=Robiginitomaculum antarcticum TaxID=437507 RepID=UPI00037625FD|nr:TRAFs-binding domain-containing protein [Robiginitomaculum antarcticum]